MLDKFQYTEMTRAATDADRLRRLIESAFADVSPPGNGARLATRRTIIVRRSMPCSAHADLVNGRRSIRRSLKVTTACGFVNANDKQRIATVNAAVAKCTLGGIPGLPADGADDNLD